MNLNPSMPWNELNNLVKDIKRMPLCEAITYQYNADNIYAVHLSIDVKSMQTNCVNLAELFNRLKLVDHYVHGIKIQSDQDSIRLFLKMEEM